MKITETETQTETKKVEETTTIEKIKCDVCGHEYEMDEWDGKHFMYELDVDAAVEENKHICMDCYDVIFDDT